MNFTNAVVGGRLTRDPELVRSAAGKVYCKIGLAVNTGFGDRKKTSFLDWTAFGKNAESISQHFRKGSPIVLIGEIEEDKWEAKDGTKRSKVCFVVRSWSFADSKSDTPPDRGPSHGTESFDRDVPAPGFSEQDVRF